MGATCYENNKRIQNYQITATLSGVLPHCRLRKNIECGIGVDLPAVASA